MIRNAWLAAVVVVLAPIPCLGQMGSMGGGMGGMGGGMQMPRGTEEWSVKIETFGNQTVTGKLHLLSVMVQCDVGTYEIKPSKVKSIQFAAAMGAADQGMYNNIGLQREGVVVTSTDEKINGVVTLPNWWKVETDLGTLTPDGGRLRSITFLAKVEQAQKPGGGTKPGGEGKPGESNKPNGGQPQPQPKPDPEQKP